MRAWFRKSDPITKNINGPVDYEAAEQKLRSFVAAKSKFVEASEIANETKLFSSGLLDSLAFIELVLYVEKEFHLKLADFTEVNLNSLDSIERILDPIFKRSGNVSPAS